jgi:RimJ/RimL family protein N-acetyltransferase
VSESVELKNQSNISIRPVILSDSPLLLSWRNHPEVRKWSRDINEIEVETHEKWFSDWVSEKSKKGFFFVIEYLGNSVGMIRFDLKTENSLEISVLVESSFQGRGIAKVAISAAISEIRVDFPEFTVLASVHENNLPSIELFKRLGFTESEKNGYFLQFFRKFFSEDF